MNPLIALIHPQPRPRLKSPTSLTAGSRFPAVRQIFKGITHYLIILPRQHQEKKLAFHQHIHRLHLNLACSDPTSGTLFWGRFLCRRRPLSGTRLVDQATGSGSSLSSRMMDSQQRGRSASVGHRSIHQLNQSPSPHPFPDNSTGLDLDLSGSSTFPTGTFNADVGTSNSLDDMQYAYLNSSTQGPRYDQSPLPNHGLPDLKQSFLPNGISTDLSDRPSSLDMEQSNQQFPSDMLGITNPSRFGDFSQDQDSTKEQAQRYDNTFSIDPELQEIPSQQQSVNPADIMSDMSSPPNMMPTPPSLMPPESRSSRQGSPVPQQSQLYSPSHSRHTSLDPSSAMFASGQQQTDWAGMLRQSQFQTHRRAPSEHSDVSSSVTPSPFLQQEGFDIDPNRSPMMHAQPDNPLYQEAFGIEHFSLSEPPPQHPGTSPAHSPFISPRVPPYSALGIPHESNQLLLSPNVHNGFAGGPGPEIYAGQTDAFPPFNPNLAVNEMGQAAQMAPPPDITVDLAPTTRQPNFEPSRPENDTDALSPPDRGEQDIVKLLQQTVGPVLTCLLSRTQRTHTCQIRNLHFAPRLA